MAIQISISNAIGSRYRGSVVPPIDPDAQAFITAASITDPTQQSAINQLVVDLKGYGLWTKIYAAYPMVGGTSTSTSYNLKNTAQYQITWNGGWTWNNNGVTPNGTNGFGNTGFNPVTVGITKTNFGVSAYSRTNIVQVGSLIGLMDSTGLSRVEIRPRSNSTTDVLSLYDDSFGASNYLTNSLGLFTAVRTGTTQKYYQGATEKSQRTGFSATADINGNIYLGARNWVTQTPDSYSTKQIAWVAFHEFFNATEMNNYNTAVQTFQTTLGRSIGTQTVSDADAQAFVTNAGIVDQVEANAINNLVIGLKADGLWTKIYATYPMVGGSSSTMKYNLKNPLDTDAAFRAVFSGGWTYSNNGILGNGANSFADTKFNPTTIGVTKSNFGVSVYSRTNTNGYKVDIGAVDTPASYVWIVPRFDSVTDFAGSFDDSNFNGNYLTNTLGLISVVRDSATTQKFYQAGVQKATRTAFNATGNINQNIYFGARNNVGVAANYTDREYSLIAIHEGFNATEMTNFNTRIQTFQTALNRQVP